MKVLFALGFLLETLGLDVGVSRLLLTFMLQSVAFISFCLILYLKLTMRVFVRLPNSRKNESEADFIGLRLMSYVYILFLLLFHI